MSRPKVVILTGAGVSAESGLNTFRDNNGLWEKHRVEDVATPEAFARDPEKVYRFYNARRAQLQDPAVQPNAAHIALAKLERTLGDNLLLVTQNVDDLHERGGSQRVIHMHGTLLSARCMATGQSRTTHTPFDATTACWCCNQPGNLRPDIVWFGEMPMAMDTIYEHIMQADFFVAIGTSGQVYPAAGFAEMARDYGVHTVLLNLEPADQQHVFAEYHAGPAATTVPAFVSSFLRS